MKPARINRHRLWKAVWGATPEIAGVYIVKSSERIIYVGQSMRVRSRLRNHGKIVSFLSLCANSISVIPEPCPWRRQVIEKELQKKHRPPLCVDTDFNGITREWVNKYIKQSAFEEAPI